MGNKSAKTTNRLLGQQTGRANQIADVAGGRSQEQYDLLHGNQGRISSALWDLYGAAGSDEGEGGGGGGYTPANFGDLLGYESTALPFYQRMMKEGAFDERERGAIESSATAPISGIYEGILRNLNSRAAGRGLGTNTGNLLRDQAYAASEASKGAFADIAKMVAESKFRGAGGVTGIEGEVMGLKERETERKRAFDAAERARAASAAGAGARAAAASRSEQRSILDQILGITGDRDLSYMDRQLGGTGLGMSGITSRVDETPYWQKVAGSVIPAAAGAAVGAFTGGYKKKQPYTETTGYQEAMTPLKPYTFR